MIDPRTGTPLTVTAVRKPESAPVGLRDRLLPVWQEFAFSPDEPDDAELTRWVRTLIEQHAAAYRDLKRIAVQADAEFRQWSERQLMNALGVDQLPDVIPAIELLKAEAERAARQSDPLVLSLPEEPVGAAGLMGTTTGHRWSPTEFGRWVDEETGQVRGFVQVLEREGSVTVVMREPRTWPRLDGAPDDTPILRGISGKTYGYSHFVDDVPLYSERDEDGDQFGRAYSFYVLQHLDGPLTEVFDDGGEPA